MFLNWNRGGAGRGTGWPEALLSLPSLPSLLVSSAGDCFPCTGLQTRPESRAHRKQVGAGGSQIGHPLRTWQNAAGPLPPWASVYPLQARLGLGTVSEGVLTLRGV